MRYSQIDQTTESEWLTFQFTPDKDTVLKGKRKLFHCSRELATNVMFFT